MDKITLPSAAGGDEMTVAINDFPLYIRDALMLHGLQQKIADSCASAKSKGWTEAQAREACYKVLASLQAGTWASRATGPRATNEEAFVVSRIVAKIKANAKAKGASLPDDATLRQHAVKIMGSDKHAAWVNALKAEYAAKRSAVVDIDDLI